MSHVFLIANLQNCKKLNFPALKGFIEGKNYQKKVTKIEIEKLKRADLPGHDKSVKSHLSLKTVEKNDFSKKSFNVLKNSDLARKFKYFFMKNKYFS